MIVKFKIFLFLIVLASPFVIIAQEGYENNSLDGTMLLTKELLISNNNVSAENASNTNQYYQNNNLIQIQQIGNYNYSSVYVRSSDSQVLLNQDGDNNYTNIYRNAYSLNENVNQTGNNNFISDFSVYSDEPVNVTFNQYGNNLTIINNGSNSISKNLQINQTGNSGTVYIYNR